MIPGLNVWSTGAPEPGDWTPIYCGPRTSRDTHVISVPSYVAETIVARHNAEVEATRATRATVGDLEQFAIRVLAGAIRELLRGLLPRRLRHRARRSTHGDKPVYERTGR